MVASRKKLVCECGKDNSRNKDRSEDFGYRGSLFLLIMLLIAKMAGVAGGDRPFSRRVSKGCQDLVSTTEGLVKQLGGGRASIQF